MLIRNIFIVWDNPLDEYPDLRRRENACFKGAICGTLRAFDNRGKECHYEKSSL